MRSPLFIGIDIGTQGTKAVLCDDSGKLYADAFCPSQLLHGRDNSIYQSPEDIYSSVITVITALTQRIGPDADRITALAIDSQMAGIMGVDESYDPVTPYDSWLDGRCGKYAEQIKAEAEEDAVTTSGGQVINSHAAKILWWKNEEPQAYHKIKSFVQPNSYAAAKLCGLTARQAFTDYTFLHFNNFSDILSCGYNLPLLKYFGVDKDKLPSVLSPDAIIGEVSREAAGICGLPSGVKVIAGCGDTAASSLGAGINRKGLAYDVAGTASVFACCTDIYAPDISHKTLMFARSVCRDLFTPLAYIGGGGMCLEWFSRLCKQSLPELDRQAEAVSTPIYFVPHFSGRALPYDQSLSGAFFGISADTGDAELHRAIMEGIAFEYKGYLDILRRSGCLAEDTRIVGVGGGAKSSVFSQIKADVLMLPYFAPESVNSAPVACALLAGHAAGYISRPLEELFTVNMEGHRAYLPDSAKAEGYRIKCEKYFSALDHYKNIKL